MTLIKKSEYTTQLFFVLYCIPTFFCKEIFLLRVEYSFLFIEKLFYVLNDYYVTHLFYLKTFFDLTLK